MSIINQSILFLITLIHIVVVLFLIVTPFTSLTGLHFLHVIIIPFILLHWYLNDNTCALTIAEQFIREKTYGKEANKEECFTYKLIAPIYDFNKNYDEYSKFTYFSMIALWSLSVKNLVQDYSLGKIQTLKDLTRI